MAGKVQTSYDRFPYNVIGVIGDSIGYNETYGVRAHEFWPELSAASLRALGCAVKTRNFCRSGDSTGQVLSRMSLLATWETPSIVGILVGTNDYNSGRYGTVLASPAPTATTFTVSTDVGASMPAGTHILVAGFPTIVTAQSGDNITFEASSDIGTPATGATVAPDTQANIEAMIIAAKQWTDNVFVVGHPYMNYSSTADTTTTQQATGALLRGFQSAAAAAQGAAYVDLYAACRDRILAGIDVQGSFTYHVLDSNVHPSVYGNQVIASVVVDKILSLSPKYDSGQFKGWLAGFDQ